MQAQWESVMGENRSHFKGKFLPVDSVSWDDCQKFISKVNVTLGGVARLPTEAEWEYACRAGSTTAYNTGDTFPQDQWKEQANHRDKVPVSLQVALFQPNAWGLYDMHGNVEEWCQDLVDGQYRAVRGGRHNTPVEFLRADARSASIPQDRSVLLGFRIAESVAKPTEAFFAEPLSYVIPPVDGTPFYSHNHQPAVTWLPDGGLLAIWFSTDAEAGREMVVLQSEFDGEKWAPATLFCKVPGRNMTGSALLTCGNKILHFQGIGDDNALKAQIPPKDVL
jgi:hypothetical protein